jgi:serine/threonine protein kinase
VHGSACKLFEISVFVLSHCFNECFKDERLETIGKGPVGEVWKARRKSDGAILACKSVPVSKVNVSSIQDALAVFSGTPSPYLMYYVETFEHDSTFYLVGELSEGPTLRMLLTNAKTSKTDFPEPVFHSASLFAILLWLFFLIVSADSLALSHANDPWY